ncbi:ATP-grasp domain-containing protein [Halobaculum limi]|uniref:carboxylate--amine ligase n=1 Tax=Halobaculum limi TaxID=3031916 RepID=UPI002406A71F|nr:ATP-grasp domain-containing protein [Halobaculum sp. YSMS11]
MTLANGSVLVLDANGQAGLSLVRSLGRRGLSVTAGSHVRSSLGRLSRHSVGGYHHPDPHRSEQRFVDHLLEHLEASSYEVVFPVLDSTSAVCSRHKETLERTGTTVAVEDWERFAIPYDKARLFRLATSLPVRTPETWTPESPATVAALADDITYPVVVKPRSKTVWDSEGECHFTRVGDDNYADSPAELVETYERLLERHPVLAEEDHYPMVQARIPGSTTTTVVLADAGEILLHFQEERVRTYPASGGESTLLRPVHDPEMFEAAETIIRALEWTGPAMVEFMRTPAGESYLIEVNGRYWGSVPFAIESGVDIPWHHYRLLRGETVDPPDYTNPVPLFHRLLYGDVKWLSEQLRAGNPAAIAQFLWACFVAKQAFVSVNDPVPTLRSLVGVAAVGGRTAARRLRTVAARGGRSVAGPVPDDVVTPRGN